jgi:hypothetical protein
MLSNIKFYSQLEESLHFIVENLDDKLTSN